MENRIDQTFTRLRSKGQKAFIAYISAGDPNLEATKTLAVALEKAGVDIIELGVPFSDPLADGIVNQMAAQRGLESGTTLPGILQCVRELRQYSQIPLVLYTYTNPIYTYGLERFEKEAVEAGVDGVLILDLPPDEDSLQGGALKQIRLIAPTTPSERIQKITAQAQGFIYYVSREGVTGEQSTVATALDERVALIRATTELPIVIGFGVSNPDQAHEIARCADGVVVGSAIVKKIAEFGKHPDLAEKVVAFVQPLVAGAKR